MKETPTRKPDWLRVKLGGGPGYARVKAAVRDGGLHTVCEGAGCPNMGLCWEHGHATLMILGNTCTRSCRFCGVPLGGSGKVDTDEPRRVAEAVKALQLREVVLTSVTRDDLEDGGAGIWADTIRRVRQAVPGASIEVLVPDFGGTVPAVDRVIAAAPEVFGHNLETVPRLYPSVRPGGDYVRSLGVLRRAAAAGLLVKTGLMVGLGESREELLAVLEDALDCGCRIAYIGQYLQPTHDHLPVARYVEPAEFDAVRQAALKMGFAVVAAAPLVRSSYHSDEQSEYIGNWKLET